MWDDGSEEDGPGFIGGLVLVGLFLAMITCLAKVGSGVKHGEETAAVTKHSRGKSHTRPATEED